MPLSYAIKTDLYQAPEFLQKPDVVIFILRQHHLFSHFGRPGSGIYRGRIDPQGPLMDQAGPAAKNQFQAPHIQRCQLLNTDNVELFQQDLLAHGPDAGHHIHL